MLVLGTSGCLVVAVRGGLTDRENAVYMDAVSVIRSLSCGNHSARGGPEFEGRTIPRSTKSMTRCDDSARYLWKHPRKSAAMRYAQHDQAILALPYIVVIAVVDDRWQVFAKQVDELLVDCRNGPLLGICCFGSRSFSVLERFLSDGREHQVRNFSYLKAEAAAAVRAF